MQNLKEIKQIKIKELIRDENETQRALEVSYHLLSLVSNWPEKAGLVLDITSAIDKRVNIVMTKFGTKHFNWHKEIEMTLEGNATIEIQTNVKFPEHKECYELVPYYNSLSFEASKFRQGLDKEKRYDNLTSTSITDMEINTKMHAYLRQNNNAPLVAFQTPGTTLLKALSVTPGVTVRYILMAANNEEQLRCRSKIEEHWIPTLGEIGMYDYIETPLKIRAFILNQNPNHIPASVLSICNQWVRNDVIEKLNNVPNWTDVSKLVEDSIHPFGIARGWMRFPVSGIKPIKGVKTKIKEPEPRQLDPIPPKPKTPIVLGKMETIDSERQNIALDMGDLCRHIQIRGGAGTGKTTLLTQIAKELYRQKIPFVFFDSHTDVSNNLPKLIDKDKLDRLFTIDHGDEEYTFPLNSAGKTEDDRDKYLENLNDYLQKRFDPNNQGFVGPAMLSYITSIFKACNYIFRERNNQMVLAKILSDKNLLKDVIDAIKKTDSELSNKMYADMFMKGTSEATEDHLRWVNSKFQPLFSSKYVANTLGMGKNTVDLEEVLEKNLGLIVNINMPTLGNRPAQMLAVMWLIMLRQEIVKREDKTKPFVILLDEAHIYQYGPLASMIDELRKWNVGIVVAHQRSNQLDSQVSDALEANVGSFISFATSPRDGQDASLRLMDWSMDELLHLPTLTAAVSLSRNGAPTPSFTLFVENLFAKMKESNMNNEIVKKQSREKYGIKDGKAMSMEYIKDMVKSYKNTKFNETHDRENNSSAKLEPIKNIDSWISDWLKEQ